MAVRLLLQRFWFRALGYGLPFTVLFGVYDSVHEHSPVGAGLTTLTTLLAGTGFGLAMAYYTQPTHAEMTEAVSGLDPTGRADAVKAVTVGRAPGDPTVRRAAIRLGHAHLRNRSDAQLKRDERRTWLVVGLFAVVATAVTVTSSSAAQAIVTGVLLTLCLAALPLGALRIRKIQRNIARLTESAASR